MDSIPVLADSPHWDAETRSLYYCDMINKTHSLRRYDFDEGRTYGATIEGETAEFHLPGYIIPIEGRKDKFLVGIYHDHKVIKWDGKSPTAKVLCTQISTDSDLRPNRVHDTHADPAGNMYTGVTRIPTNLFETCLPKFNALPFSGHVYKSTDGKPAEVIVDDMVNPNAMVWNLDKNRVYLVDSCNQTIKGFNWDPVTTALSRLL